MRDPVVAPKPPAGYNLFSISGEPGAWNLKWDRHSLFDAAVDLGILRAAGQHALRRGTDDVKAEVARFNPDDVAGYERFMVEAEKCDTQTGDGKAACIKAAKAIYGKP